MDPINSPAGSGGAASAQGAPSGPACQTCRYRKSRCDRRRPKCGVCQRLDTACEYREPALPPKTDKSLSDVVETLQRVEQKLDSLSISPNNALDSSISGDERGRSDPSSGPEGTPRDHGRYTSAALQRSLLAQLQKASEQLTIPHKVLLWPCIYADVVASGLPMAYDLPTILREGVRWFARTEVHKHPTTLPAEIALPFTSINVSDRSSGSSPNIVFPTLLPQQVRESCAAYFDTFNLLYPILDRIQFTNEVQEKVLAQGHADGDPASVLFLLVYALGQVALEGAFGTPISAIDGHPSGFRGGSADNPPGLAAFNEARRRSGFIAMECNLQTVQMLLLQMFYVGSHARHIDFWRTATAASMAFLALIKLHPLRDWTSAYGHQVKCVYWTCSINETFYHIDLDLPGTDIKTLEDEIYSPDFSIIAESAAKTGTAVPWLFHAHFLALIALRAITGRIHDAMQAAEVSVLQVEANVDPATPPPFVVRELSRQLDSWHATLPLELRWSRSDGSEMSDADIEPGTFPGINQLEPLQQHTFGIATCQLRARFYYTQFMLYRPFVYKTLHSPERMTAQDADYCAIAIRSACDWPHWLRAGRDVKRLLPHLFSWTQMCLGVLLIFRMTMKDNALRAICDEQVSGWRIVQATGILLDWLRDIRQLDGIAEWCYETISQLLSDEDEDEEIAG